MELFGRLSLFTTLPGRVTKGGKGAVWVKVGAQSKELCKGTEQRTEHTQDAGVFRGRREWHAHHPP